VKGHDRIGIDNYTIRHCYHVGGTGGQTKLPNPNSDITFCQKLTQRDCRSLHSAVGCQNDFPVFGSQAGADLFYNLSRNGGADAQNATAASVDPCIVPAQGIACTGSFRLTVARGKCDGESRNNA
jgi:hypothetical protein